MKAVWLLVLLMGCSEDVVDCLGSGPVYHLDHESNRCIVAGTHFQCDVCGVDGPGPCAIVDDAIYKRLVVCGSSCQGHDEAFCRASPSCRATYVDGQFARCWQIEQREDRSEMCAGLDADACADHDDCVAFYTTKMETAVFDHCADEAADLP